MLNRRIFLASASVAAIMPAGFSVNAQQAAKLQAAPTAIRIPGIPGSSETDALTFNGSLPAPVLRAKTGQQLALDLENALSGPLSLHWHGLRGPNALDGVAGLTGPAVQAGQSSSIVLPLRDPGLVVYRPLLLGSTAEATDRGLAGALIIDDNAPLPDISEDIVALIDDVLVDADGKHVPFDAESAPFGAGRLGNHVLVNGRAGPIEQAVAPGARVRLRLANLANARMLRLRIEGARATVIAVDSQPSEVFELSRGTLPFLPGTRYELLVDMPTTAGAIARIVADLGQPLPLIVLSATGSGKAGRDLPAPGALPANPTLPVAIRLQDAVRADLVLTGGATRNADGSLTIPSPDARGWRINGRLGDLGGPPAVRARTGSPVVLTLVNRTHWFHALHLHGHSVRRLHALDDGWEPYWLDTIGIAPDQTVRIAFLADNPGRWLIGSSVLERLDAGLFTWFEVG